MRVLITGATGFVGRVVAAELAKRGIDIVCSSRRSKEETAGSALVHCTYRPGNLMPGFDWTPILAGVDVVVHLGAKAHVSPRNKPEMSLLREVNVLGTRNLAQQAAEAGVRRFILASSIGVNGSETFGQSFREADCPQPVSAYAQSKLEAELAVQDIANGTGMEWVILRPPLIYGGAGIPGNLRKLMLAIDHGLPLPLALVQNKRSLLAAENFADVVALCIDHAGAANQLFLVSDIEDVSTPMLISLLAEGMHRPVRLLPVPLKLLEFISTVLGSRRLWRQVAGSLQIDSSKVRERLQWRPPLCMADGLRAAAAEFRQHKLE